MLRRFGVPKRYVSDRWNYVIDVVITIGALVGFAQFGLWVFDRTLPVKVHFRVIRTISVPPGGEFRYLNFFTRSEFCETTVERWFVGSDEVVRRIDPLPSAMPTEGLNVPQMSEARIKVPLDMPGGRTKSCFRSQWICNPVQRVWPIRGKETCIDFLVKPRPPPIRPYVRASVKWFHNENGWEQVSYNNE